MPPGKVIMSVVLSCATGSFVPGKPIGGLAKVSQNSSNRVLPTLGSQFLDCHDDKGPYMAIVMRKSCSM